MALVSTSTQFGGAEVYLVNLVGALAETTHFSVFVPAGVAAETARRLEAAGADVCSIPGLGRRPTFGGSRGLKEQLDHPRPSLVHASLTDQGDGIAPILAARGRPLALTLNLVLPQRAGWKETLSRSMMARADARIGVSEAVADYLASLRLSAEIVRPGIEVPALRADARAELGLPPDGLVIGGIGRLHEQKGWDILCEAAGTIREGISAVSIVVIGDGPERTRLLELGRASDVRFVGYRENASSYLSAFDVLAVPSRYEALGLVAVEAMMAGVTVVASATGGLPEVVRDDGLLVAPDNSTALAAALVDVLRDDRKREALGARGRQRTEVSFSLEQMARGTRRVYEALCR